MKRFNKINTEVNTRAFEKGDIILGCGKGKIYKIHTGVVEIIETKALNNDDSSEFTDPIIDFVGTGQTLKLTLESQRIRIVSNLSVIQWFYADKIENQSILAEQVYQDIESSRSRALRMLSALRAVDTKEKIYALILHLTIYNDVLKNYNTEYYQPEGYLKLPIHLSHNRIANTIGTTRPSVTKLIKELKEEGRLINLNTRSERYPIFAVKNPEHKTPNEISDL